MSEGGSASTMSGPRRASASASSGESAKTIVPRPTSWARAIAAATSPGVSRFSECESSVPVAPASRSASASTRPRRVPAGAGHVLGPDVDMPCALGDAWNVYRLGVEHDGHAERLGGAVGLAGERERCGAPAVALEADLEHGRPDGPQEVHLDDHGLDAEHCAR